MSSLDPFPRRCFVYGVVVLKAVHIVPMQKVDELEPSLTAQIPNTTTHIPFAPLYNKQPYKCSFQLSLWPPCRWLVLHPPGPLVSVQRPLNLLRPN